MENLVVTKCGVFFKKLFKNQDVDLTCADSGGCLLQAYSPSAPTV